jgi:hypothetical protein
MVTNVEKDHVEFYDFNQAGVAAASFLFHLFFQIQNPLFFQGIFGQPIYHFNIFRFLY